MANASADVVECVERNRLGGTRVGTVAPPLAPDLPAIDRAHLQSMTGGDSRLEGEVLQLFERQADMLLTRMGSEFLRTVGALAHTLIGSARGIGAWKVAAAAEAVERIAAEDAPATLTTAIGRLATAIGEAELVIATLKP